MPIEEKPMRCPEHAFRLFGKIIVDKKTNLIEVKCRECTKRLNANKKENDKIGSVYHYYDLAGLVETKIKYSEKKEGDIDVSSNINS